MKNNTKTAWFCTSCGAQAPKWQGRCPACGEWNTMVEERIVTEKKAKTLSPAGRETDTHTAAADS